VARQVILIDDIDGSTGAETLTYTFEGQDYEIDLSEQNAQKFRAALAPYVEKSREVERSPVPSAGGRRTRRSSSSGRSKEELAAIRAWAEANGHDVAPRGRIKREILEAYDKAHA
jgi:hypothetical protein